MKTNDKKIVIYKTALLRTWWRLFNIRKLNIVRRKLRPGSMNLLLQRALPATIQILIGSLSDI